MLIFNTKKLNKGKILESWAPGFLPDNLMTSNKYMLDNIDIYVQFNIYNPYLNNKLNPIYKFILDSNKPFLVCEEGALRQLPKYRRWGWTSYKNGIGNFNNENVDDSRWNRLQQQTGIKFLDWNSPGDNILIMGQLDFDSALIELYDAGYKSFDQWIEKQIKTIRIYTDRSIIVRPHPLGSSTLFKDEARLNTQYKNVSVSKNYNSSSTLSGGIGLQKDLKNSYCAITYNSNSAVEAIEKGIPVFTLSSTSSAYDIGHKDLSKIESLDYNIDISTWCNRIAYTVWNEEEIANGSMWGHLREIL